MFNVVRAALFKKFPNDIEDVLHDASTNAFLSIKTFEGRAKVSTWLCRIALNEACTFLRKRGYELSHTLNIEKVLSFDDNDQVVESVVLKDNRPTADKLLIEVELRQAVDNLIKHYSDQDRQIVGLLVDGRQWRNAAQP